MYVTVQCPPLFVQYKQFLKEGALCKELQLGEKSNLKY